MVKVFKNEVSNKVMGWIGYIALIGAILYFFAPPSWWQFGVTAVEKRKVVKSFTLDGLNGGDRWDFAKKRGKVLLINYWATWCGPCRYETPGLVNIANEFKDRNFEIVGVSVDENLAAIRPFIDYYQVNYPILRPGNDPNLGTGGMRLPTTFLYDKKGRLAKKYTGMVLESTFRSDIESLLAEN